PPTGFSSVQAAARSAVRCSQSSRAAPNCRARQTINGPVNRPLATRRARLDRAAGARVSLDLVGVGRRGRFRFAIHLPGAAFQGLDRAQKAAEADLVALFILRIDQPLVDWYVSGF